MTKADRMSYMILFCALLLVRQSKATMQELFVLLPARGKAETLATSLTSAGASHEV